MTRCHRHNRKHRFTVSLLITLTSSFLAGSIYADTSASVSRFSKTNLWNPVATIMVGGSFSSNVGRSKYFPSTNPATEMYFNYKTNGGSQSVPIAGLFLGTEMLLRPSVRLQVGLSYTQPFAYDVAGTLTQGVAIIGSGLPDPNVFSQYHYSYNISVHQILVQSKLLFDVHQRFHPFVTLGIGSSINKAFDFQSGVTPPHTALSNNFQNNTNTAFSYSAGFGLDVDMTSHLRAGLGYRFSNYGAVKTGHSILDAGGTNNNGVYNPPITSAKQLTQSHLYANEIFAQLTYLFS